MNRIQRRVTAASAVLSVAALVYGCSSNSDSGGNDAGNQEASTREAAAREAAASSGSGGGADVFVPLGCPVPDALTGWMAPSYLSPKHDPTACTRQDIIDYSMACITSQQAPRDCPVYRTTHVGCAACLESTAADPTWGPLVFWPNGQTELNTAGCLQLLDPASASCAMKVQALDQCAHAACDTTCAGAPTFFMGQCTSSAYSGPCMTYSTASLCAVPDAGMTAAAICQQVVGASIASQFQQLAPYFCGGAGADTSDGGTPIEAGPGGSVDSSAGGTDAVSDAPRDAPRG